MPYCTRCGLKLPEDKEARFCPNCGTPILKTLEHVRRGKEKEAAPRGIPRKNRFLSFLGILLLTIAVTFAGALSKVDGSEAQVMVEDFKEIEKMLQIAGIQLIFGNNMMYCLAMFIPFLGPLNGFYVLYSTGRVLAALSYVLEADPTFLFLNMLIYPHAWLEYVSYSLAISESMWLSFHVLKFRLKGIRAEMMNAAKLISICAVLLLAGAFIEMALIKLALPSIPT